MDSCWIEFPNGVQAALLINSVGGSYDYKCAVLSECYDNAWVAP